MYIKDPLEIEKRSFEIITSEMGKRAERFSGEELSVVKRVIHTTADFEYADIIEFQNDAVIKGKEAFEKGCRIYCDTNMIVNGLNAKFLSKYGVEAYTLVSDESIDKEAKERGITRSIVGIERAAADRRTKIFLIGNAPTALFTLIETIKKGSTNAALIVGVPVGFVGAEESKTALNGMNIPFIRTNGRKGGSTVAVAIMHGIAYQLKNG